MKELLRLSATAAPLRQQVVDSLRNAITAGVYAPGQRLVELDLSERLGVSRPLVREAMRQLEAERLIDIVPNRGPAVRRLDRAEAIAVYDVRGALEAAAARLMATRGTPSQMAALGAAFGVLAKAYAADDVEGVLSSKARFYDALFAGANNCVIPELLGNLNARTLLLRRLSLSSPSRRVASVEELRAVVDAIIRRDPGEADRLMAEHVRNAGVVALAAMAG